MDAAFALIEAVHRRGVSAIRAGARDKLVVLAYPGFEGETLDLEVGFSLTRRLNTPVQLPNGLTLELTELPAVETMVTLVRSGPISEGHLAFGATALWIEANGYRIDGPCREVFLEVPFDKPAQQNPVIEIQYPILKAD
jgi:effector-binding domain-containing protein